jgi:hypothetical protein
VLEELAMTLSMYELTVPGFIRGFGVLSGYLEKAEAFARTNALGAGELIEARLAPDMFTFARQIQSASDKARYGVARLAAIEAPSFADSETTFAELEERVAKTVVFLRAVDPKRFDGSDARTIELKQRGTYRGDQYLLTMLLPDFYFHVATAHGILRHRGVPIGKTDYLTARTRS